MRAMGPGSVSSLLKIALDVVNAVLWIAVGVLALSALVVLFVPLSDNTVLTADDGGVSTEIALTGPMLSAALLTAAGYCGVLVFIVGRLRRVFATLTAGDPFHPENVKRLRLIGLGLAGLEVGNLLSRWGAGAILKGAVNPDGRGIDLTAWFSVLVVFVLAEVFREGARLRREAELTI